MADQPVQVMLEHALRLAKLGFRIFPIASGRKHPPAIIDWPGTATDDEVQVRLWWKQNPYANIGIACGSKDGKGLQLVVFDFDTRDGKKGMEAFRRWFDEGLLDTFRVHTANGGIHAFFLTPTLIRGSLGVVAPDVDIKAHRGYVVAPGSMLVGATPADVKIYKWDTRSRKAPARLPPKLENLAIEAMSKASSAPTNVIPLDQVHVDSDVAIHRALLYLINEAPEAIEGQKGDLTTFQVAQRLRAMAISEDKAYELMSQYYNVEKCKPPWTESDLRQKVKNAYNYSERAPLPGSAVPEIEMATAGIAPSPKGEEVNVKPEPETMDKGPEQETPGTKKTANGSGKHLSPVFADWLHLDREPLPIVLSLVSDWFALGHAGLFPGYGGLGKSTVMCQLSVCVAAGIPWMGMPVIQGPVCYAVAEDSDIAVKRRFMIAMRHYGVKFEDVYGKSLFVWPMGDHEQVPEFFRLNNDRMEVTKLYEVLYDWASRIKPKLIVLDPLSHIFTGNENDRVHAQFVMYKCQQLARVCGGVVIVLQHPSVQGMTSNRGSSGSTGWHGGARFQLNIKKIGLGEHENEFEHDRGLRRLTIQKTQFGKPGAYVDLQYRDGLFLPLSESDKKAKLLLAKDVFMALLSRFTDSGRYVNAKDTPRGQYAPRVFAEEPEAGEAGIDKAALTYAMLDLFKEERITQEEYLDEQRKKKFRIVLKTVKSEGGLMD